MHLPGSYPLDADLYCRLARRDCDGCRQFDNLVITLHPEGYYDVIMEASGFYAVMMIWDVLYCVQISSS